MTDACRYLISTSSTNLGAGDIILDSKLLELMKVAHAKLLYIEEVLKHRDSICPVGRSPQNHRAGTAMQTRSPQNLTGPATLPAHNADRRSALPKSCIEFSTGLLRLNQ